MLDLFLISVCYICISFLTQALSCKEVCSVFVVLVGALSIDVFVGNVKVP